MKLLGRLQPVGIPGSRRIRGTAATATRATSAAAGRIPGDGVTLRAPPRLDPRLYQITVLASLLVYGMAWLGLDIHPGRAVAILAAALMTQWAATAVAELPRFDPKSALISGLSLCLLLRTNDPWLAMLAAVVAVASKFLLRVRGKHVFNPTNFAPGRDDARHRPGLGLSGAMGQRGDVRVPARLGGGAGREPGRPRRRDVDLPRVLCGALARPIALARRSAGHPAASPGERRPRPLRLLHDLRPADDAGLARGPHAVRRPRRGRRLRRAVQALPHQWPALVARRVLPRRPPDRPAPPRPALPVAPGRERRDAQETNAP